MHTELTRVLKANFDPANWTFGKIHCNHDTMMTLLSPHDRTSTWTPTYVFGNILFHFQVSPTLPDDILNIHVGDNILHVNLAGDQE